MGREVSAVMETLKQKVAPRGWCVVTGNAANLVWSTVQGSNAATTVVVGIAALALVMSVTPRQSHVRTESAKSPRSAIANVSSTVLILATKATPIVHRPV